MTTETAPVADIPPTIQFEWEEARGQPGDLWLPCPEGLRVGGRDATFTGPRCRAVVCSAVLDVWDQPIPEELEDPMGCPWRWRFHRPWPPRSGALRVWAVLVGDGRRRWERADVQPTRERAESVAIELSGWVPVENGELDLGGST